MKHLLAHLVAGQPLSREQAVEAFELMMSGSATPAQIAALLSMIQQRGPTVDEITGAASVMRAHASLVVVPPGLTPIDTCGTGGDHSGTFNISTATAIVAAAVLRPKGFVVAKHGNRAVTSKSGSSQVLEALGVKLNVTGETLTQCLDVAGLCFCHAPAHHPGMKHIQPVRIELGFRTIYNVLGPIANPAGAKRQLMGVYDAGLTEPIANVFKKLGSKHAMVVHGNIPASAGGHSDNSGIDELTITGASRISQLRDGEVITYLVTPEEAGLTRAHVDMLHADSPQSSALMIVNILNAQKGPPRDIVCLNAAAALMTADIASSLKEGVVLAQQAIDSGRAAETLDALMHITAMDTTA
jgi:anthranilate phosphoribosyltransferase